MARDLSALLQLRARPYLLDMFDSARQRRDARVLGLLPRMSGAVRRTAAEGGQLNLTGETWRAAVRTTSSRDT